MLKMAAMAAIPPVRTALEAYLGFLETSSSAAEQEVPVTPHIDRVLRGYQRRGERGGKLGKERGVEESSSSPVCSTSAVRDGGGGYESRLMQLERQLSQLLQKTKTARKKGPATRQPHSIGISPTTSSESCDEEATPPTQKRSQQTRRPQTATTTQSAVERCTRAPSHTLQRAAGKRERRGRKVSARETRSERDGVEWDRNGHVRRKQADVKVVREGGGRRDEGVREVRTLQEDQQVKTQLVMEAQKQQLASQSKTEIKKVSQELQEERERRCKAEKAATRLVEHVRSLQSQLEESTRERELTVARVAKLDEELQTERKRGVAYEEEGRKVQELLAAAQSELEAVRERGKEQEKVVRELEEGLKRRETSHTAEKTELMDRVQAADLATSRHKRETEIVQSTLSEMRRQLLEMQELLATREREHQKALQNCKPLDGREVQDVVSRKVEQERERVQEIVEQHKQRLAEQQKAYQSLEDEFRMALRIEASRYQELRECYDGVQAQVEGYQTTTEAALRKEQRATHMIAELTAIVREQKGRLAELTRAKQENVQELKERVSELEVGMRDKHKLEVKVQTLQEENSSLSSQLVAQESVLEGLRGERQLWGRELAQQGAELAQDRGRLEAQIEALSSENVSLRSKLEHAQDAVKVKDKIVTDQQASISQLREALAVREREGEETRQDWEQEQQSLHLQLEQETENSAHLQDELSAAVERKAQLKEELATVKDELAQWKNKYSKLRGEWEERVKVIGSLEESLTQVQDTFAKRQAVLTRERDEVTQQARTAEEKLRESEEKHYTELKTQKLSHDSHMTQLAQQKDLEIEQANKRVSMVEGEMRELLAEVAREKRAMEARAQKVSLALHQLQHDFTQ